DVIIENAGKIAALFARQDCRGINLRKNARFIDGFRKRLPFANAVTNLGYDGPKPCGTCALGEQVEGAQDRDTCLDQRVELLVQDEEIRPADLLAALPIEKAADQAVPRFDGIHVQATVRQLLAGFRHGSGGFDVRENAPVRIRNAADEFAHTSSVYLNSNSCRVAYKSRPFAVSKSRKF